MSPDHGVGAIDRDAVRGLAELRRTLSILTRLKEAARALERDLFTKHDFQGILTHDPRLLGRE